MKSLRIYLSGMMILFILAGCAQANSEQPTSEIQNTDVPVITLTSMSGVNTPTLTVTPIPPPTRRPTPTIDTTHITPTVTPIPSFTRMPASKYTKTVTATVTGTNTLYVRERYWWMTGSPTPVPYDCEGITLKPDWGAIFKPRQNFIAQWRVINTGADPWHVDDIIFGFVSGTRMQSPGRPDEVYLTDGLAKTSKIALQVQMVPPREPGFYTAYWGLRKSNKKEFFCTFSVTIRVQK